MADMAPMTSAEPDGAARLPVLDILRGLAILGILFMNMEGMGGAMNAFFVPDPRRLGWGAADQVVWWTKQLVAEGTARCLLELLFGAGMVILTDRAAMRMGEAAVLRGYAWRNLVLFGFGLAHVFLLLWPGDILHTYAIAALVCMGLRRSRLRLLITLGLTLATVQLAGGVADIAAARMERATAAELARRPSLTSTERQTLTEYARARHDRAQARATAVAAIATEDAARTRDARGWVSGLWTSFIGMERQGYEIAFVWEAASTMLIGAALFRLGILQGGRSRRFYVTMTVVGYAVGLSLRGWAAWALTRFDDGLSVAPAFGEYARLLVTLGHVGLVQLLMTSSAGARVLRPFGAAGRTALTLYGLQTIVTMWLLYPPWGLALYGHQGWAALMLTALAIDAVLLVLAVWWVRHFAIAPVEWAWRSIVAGRRLPFGLAPPAAQPLPTGSRAV